jgi:hypothetical protein
MTTNELKSNLHSLIENINDKNILSGFYQLLIKSKENKVGLLWNKLSSEQQNDLEQLARKNDSELNLISNEDIMKKYQKWK